MKQRNTLAITLGAALLSSAFAVQAGSNPFAAQELSSGYSLAAHEKDHEGSCGEGKCGAEMKGEAKAAEGKCGAEASGTDKVAEGKCGEGKCGADKTE
ncbi:HvfA family oxazolone/thioamide-modified RiPP metallophore [Pseudomonas sp. BMS12]|uniref:HvfA family oxazolone/thioamide-modified RiPP metallophore n=1 Tax=Pseudomonas sp. BMS12 TaxID=1796033 RepID=UPI00083B380A|nr:hypothetical protein [Pseudomonas sp. BMS12]